MSGPERVSDPQYEVTGTLSPDVTGPYHAGGVYRGKPYYVNADHSYSIWWDGVDTWLITVGPGLTAPAKWALVSPDIEGVYTPSLPYTGNATVSEIV